MQSQTPDSLTRTLRQRFSPLVRGFHAYARWLVSISWRRFAVLAILLLIAANVLEGLPPFSWKVREVIEASEGPRPPKPPKAPTPPTPPREPVIRIETSPEKGTGTDSPSAKEGVDISIDHRGIRVVTRKPEAVGTAGSAASAASAAASGSTPAVASAASGAEAARRDIQVEIRTDKGKDEHATVRISLPPGADSREVREAIEEARRDVEEALRDLREIGKSEDEEAAEGGPITRVRHVHIGDFLTDLALLWIVASIIIKVTYKGQLQAKAEAAQASAEAAQATETAEAEQLRRQVAEARMAAMQAQVEPHFLFNTLASIDHLIETDPPRASRMQKSLIALLRATMPTLREGGAVGSRTLGQEADVIGPYLEILKVRMEERLQTHIDIPAGLRSAEFPPMMLQGLVENAIKHGLEPKEEGGTLSVRATIEDGVLQVTVCDTGIGLEEAHRQGPSDGTGTGLQNMRDRLALLFGTQAQLRIEARPEGGTCATIVLPYRVVGASA